MNHPAPLKKAANDLSPSSAAKREAIVAAATRVFLDAGYGAASMDQIATMAGVSKQTVYSHFGAKDALFEEIVKRKCAILLGDGDGVRLDGWNGKIEPVLTAAAIRFLKLILSDDNITLYRTIVAESGRFPELAQAFYRAGPCAARDRLGDYLEKAGSVGELEIDDAKKAAEMFFAMLRDHLYLGRLLGLREMPDDAEIAAHAAQAVSAFIRAHRHHTCAEIS